jgi:ParD-like antitoxin of type II bacterial toxin-antitoxin system
MTAINISEKIVQAANIQAKVFNRSVDGQIDYWAKIGKIAEENPDLSFTFIKEVLISREEVLAGETEPYLFE